MICAAHMTHWLPTSDAFQACPRTAQSLLRNWLPCWCGSIVLHVGAVCCFVAATEYGPQAWPVARGRSSVMSAPAIDAKAGKLLAKFEEHTPPIRMEAIDVPDITAKDQVRPAQRTMTETVQHSAQTTMSKEAERLISVPVGQLINDPPKSKESATDSMVVRVDPEVIRDHELLRSIEPLTAETNSPSDAKSEKALSASDGIASENSTASTASAASSGAEDNPLPQPVATNVAPPYPEEARAAGQQGTVTLRLRIGVDGRVESLKLLTSSGTPSLDESALATVKQWRFEPAHRLGRPVAMDVKTSVKFEIKPE